MFTHPKLLKAIRILLDIPQEELAKKAGISERSIRKLEAFDPDTTIRTIILVQQALEGYGVVFEQDDKTFGLKIPRELLKTTH